MKLGVVVVYLFGEDVEPLLGAHLRQIEKNTHVPYTIYGSVNRLAPRLRRQLETAPCVKTLELPPTEVRGGLEHTYYLDQLVRIAVDDGSTHIAVLHLDSFPIRPGWAEEFAAFLTDQCAMVTIDPINTACLFFHRSFYLRHHPKMRLSGEEQRTYSFQQYIAAHNPEYDSGIGYGFAAWANSMRWHRLLPTARKPGFGTIFGDTIYHLAGTTFARDQTMRVDADRSDLIARMAAPLIAFGRSALPEKVRKAVITRSPAALRHVHNLWHLREQDQAIRALVENPDQFLHALRHQAQ